MDPNELLTIRQVCHEQRVTKSAISAWIRKGLHQAGKLPTELHGKRVRIRRGTLERWLASAGQPTANRGKADEPSGPRICRLVPPDNIGRTRRYVYG